MSIRAYTNYNDGEYDDFGSVQSIRYNRTDSIGFSYNFDDSEVTDTNSETWHYLNISSLSWYKDDDTEKTNSLSIEGIEKFGAGDLPMYVEMYVKDIDGEYYRVDYSWGQFLSGPSTTVLSTSDGMKDYGFSSYYTYYQGTNYAKGIFYKDSTYGGRFVGGARSFTVPDYASSDNLYIDVYLKLDYGSKLLLESGSYSVETGSYRGYLLKKMSLGSLKSSFAINKSTTISYPTFCASSKAYISSLTVTNSTSVILYRSIDNGLNWTQIYSKQNNTSDSLYGKYTWNIDCYDKNGKNYKSRNLTLTAIPPITLSYFDADAINQTLTTTHGIKYKAVFTALGTNGTSNATTLEVAPTVEMQVLDFTLPSTVTFSEKEDYLKGSNETFSIVKTTVTDPTRIKFRHIFTHTNLPNTITPSSATALQDNTPSITENIGNWVTTPNGTYEYRIIPILDGSECYTSSTNKNYNSMSFVKAGHKLEAIRPIEMGSNKPLRIKLLTTPGKTEFPENSSVKFYVANNGNDTNIVWEELPNSCIGTPSNPNVDQFQFSNTAKTADTWKVMVKIVADKNTATTDFKLNSFTVIINGGEKDTSIPGYKYIANTVLTENATSVRIDIPQGYKKIRIEGYMTTANSTNTGYTVLLNNISTGYSSKTAEIYSSSSSSVNFPSTYNNKAFLSTSSSVGAYNHLTIDLYYDGTRWIGNMMSTANKGFSISHSTYTMTDQLSYLTLSCIASGYMAANTEITIMGVD